MDEKELVRISKFLSLALSFSVLGSSGSGVSDNVHGIDEPGGGQVDGRGRLASEGVGGDVNRGRVATIGRLVRCSTVLIDELQFERDRGDRGFGGLGGLGGFVGFHFLGSVIR